MDTDHERPRLVSSVAGDTNAKVARNKGRRCAAPSATCVTAKPSVVSVERLLQRRRWHHADCMAPMPVAAAIALWHAGADEVAHEVAVADALHAERPDIALALLQTTTPLILAGVARDTDGNAAVDASRVCRRLASHLALVASPRLVWKVISAWEEDGTGGDVGAHATTAARGDRAVWRFMLRFCFASFLGTMARSSTPIEMSRVWQAASPTMRAHILALAIKHGDETLKLAERPDCQRMWATAARATTVAAQSHLGRAKKKARSAPGLLATMRGAVASARNAALWAIALRADRERKERLKQGAATSPRDPTLLEKGKRRA
ncbi:hypothetical protein pkur_cds_828 [Pandoravirus kuranda]|uniref:Uncharacterized protein n=1 Tax=Pandoravirus kuranda TaxID=3019033 RepID=A0AA95EF98_9VIRU|nr:hypothetical protein pkur_cds_828 [Pandoravirus kuranda]